jgi:hypothetical protein
MRGLHLLDTIEVGRVTRLLSHADEAAPGDVEEGERVSCLLSNVFPTPLWTPTVTHTRSRV